MNQLPSRLAPAFKIRPVLALTLATLALLVTLGVGVAQAEAPFVDNGDGTVTDTSTGLMWNQCTSGLSGAGCASGAEVTYHWADAMGLAVSQSTANYKGYTDWRLPSLPELQTLLKLGSSPTIDSTVFPQTPASYFWSGSSDVPNPTYAWAVNFVGYTNSYYKTNDLSYVRLVRGGQYFGAFALVPGSVFTTATTATMSATSPVGATGYWLVVSRDAPPPTPAQVIAGVSYGSVTVAAAGNGAMTGKTLKTFGVTGLATGTDYDFYLVATETISEYASQLVGPLRFSTLAISAGSIVIDPVTPTTLYAGLDGAGVYKSSNGGGTWTPATSQPANPRVKALLIKPGDRATLFAATYGGGVYVSTNSSGDPANTGLTWGICKDGGDVENSGLANLNVVSLTSDATGKLYAGTEGGVFVSSDGCATWTAMNSGLPN